METTSPTPRRVLVYAMPNALTLTLREGDHVKQVVVPIAMIEDKPMLDSALPETVRQMLTDVR